DLEAEPSKGKGVAGGQRAREIFFDLAEPAAVAKANRRHRRLDNDPGIEPVLRREPWVRNAPAPRPVGRETAKTVIAFKCISAVAHKAEQSAENLRIDPLVGRRGANFAKQLVLIEGRRAGERHHMLRQ